jgi:hypothetical protein
MSVYWTALAPKGFTRIPPRPPFHIAHSPGSTLITIYVMSTAVPSIASKAGVVHGLSVISPLSHAKSQQSWLVEADELRLRATRRRQR